MRLSLLPPLSADCHARTVKMLVEPPLVSDSRLYIAPRIVAQCDTVLEHRVLRFARLRAQHIARHVAGRCGRLTRGWMCRRGTRRHWSPAASCKSATGDLALPARNCGFHSTSKP